MILLGRNARPRDDRHRDHRGRDGPPRARHAAHDRQRAHGEPHHRRVPPEQQEQIRAQLSVALIAVISQVLMPRADGTGAIAAFEVMVMTPGDREPHPQERDEQDPERRSRPRASSACSCSTTTSSSSYRRSDHRDEIALEARRTRRDAREARRARARLTPWRTGRYRSRGTKSSSGQILKERRRSAKARSRKRWRSSSKHGRPDRRNPRRARAHHGGDVARALARQAGPRARRPRDGQAQARRARTRRREHRAHVRRAPAAPRGRTLVVAISEPAEHRGARGPALHDRRRGGGRARGRRAAQGGRRPALRRRGDAMDALVAEAVGEIGRPPRRAPRRRAATSPTPRRWRLAAGHQAPAVHPLPRDQRPRVATSTSSSSTSDFRIRYRVDGALYEIEAPPAHFSLPLIARIKVMADLDITETRLPQDGRIELSIDGPARSTCASRPCRRCRRGVRDARARPLRGQPRPRAVGLRATNEARLISA